MTKFAVADGLTYLTNLSSIYKTSQRFSICIFVSWPVWLMPSFASTSTFRASCNLNWCTCTSHLIRFTCLIQWLFTRNNKQLNDLGVQMWWIKKLVWGDSTISFKMMEGNRSSNNHLLKPSYEELASRNTTPQNTKQVRGGSWFRLLVEV